MRYPIGKAIACCVLDDFDRASDRRCSGSDRQLILDQITRYYYNFGKADRQSEESFYAEDGELILGTRHYKGREGIKQAYNRDFIAVECSGSLRLALSPALTDKAAHFGAAFFFVSRLCATRSDTPASPPHSSPPPPSAHHTVGRMISRPH